MTQEDKELLLQDLSARLPYGVRFEYNSQFSQVLYETNGMLLNNHYEIEKCKPFLRPMSSMTPEEFEEYTNITEHISIGSLDFNICNPETFDYLNKKMFDYRGLIPKGLAIEVTEENNPYKE